MEYVSARSLARVANKDGGYGWVIVLGCGACNFLLVGMARSMGVLFTMFLAKFQQSAAATSTFLSIFNVLRMVLGPVASELCSRCGCRPVVMAGGLLFGLGFVFSSFAPSLAFVNVSFGVICGVGGAFIFTPPYIIVGDYFEKKKGTAMSLSTIGAGIGTVCLAPLESILISYYGSFGALLISGAVVFNVIVAGALLRPQDTTEEEVMVFSSKKVVFVNKTLSNLKTDNAELYSSMDQISISSDKARNEDCSTTDHEYEVAINVQDEKKDLQTDRKSQIFMAVKQKLSTLTNVTLIVYLLNIASMPFCLMTAVIFMPALAEELGASREQASLVLSVMGAADICGRFFFGFVFDIKCIREKKRRRLMFGIIGLLFAASTASLGLCRHWVHMAVAVFFYGLMEGGYHSQRMTVLGEFLSRPEVADGVGWSIFAQGIGNLVAFPVLGYVKDVWGTFKVGYVFGSLVFALASCIIILQYLLQRTLSVRNGKSPRL